MPRTARADIAEGYRHLCNGRESEPAFGAADAPELEDEEACLPLVG